MKDIYTDPNNNALRPTLTEATAQALGDAALLDSLKNADWLQACDDDSPLEMAAAKTFESIAGISEAVPETDLALVIFEDLVFPHYVVARKANLQGYRPEAVQSRIEELRLHLRGEKDYRIGKLLVGTVMEQPSKNIKVNRRAFINILAKNGFGPDYMREAIAAAVDIHAWPLPPSRQSPPKSHTAFIVQTKTTRAGNLRGRVTSDYPETGLLAESKLLPVRWSNDTPIQDLDVERQLSDNLRHWDDVERASLIALLRNRDGELTQPARRKLYNLLAAHVPERPPLAPSELDVLGRLEWETVARLAAYGSHSREPEQTSEQIALDLHETYERGETTFEETVVQGIIKLADQE